MKFTTQTLLLLQVKLSQIYDLLPNERLVDFTYFYLKTIVKFLPSGKIDMQNK